MVESYYLLNRWKTEGKAEFLDLGCGLGRHSMLFGRNGFHVRCFDIGREALIRTRAWAESEGLEKLALGGREYPALHGRGPGIWAAPLLCRLRAGKGAVFSFPNHLDQSRGGLLGAGWKYLFFLPLSCACTEDRQRKEGI